MAERDAVFPANPHALYAAHRYSPAVRANGLLFVNLLAVLDAAGCTFADVVDTTLFLTDPEGDLETLMRVMADYWGEPPYPALTAPGVHWLAGFRFEIKVVARLPEAAHG